MNAADIKGLREQFKPLSRPWPCWSRAGSGWSRHLLLPDGGRLLDPESGAVKDPYYGAKMLGCGGGGGQGRG